MTRTSGTRRTAAGRAALGCAALVALAGCTVVHAQGRAHTTATLSTFPADAHVITFTEDLGLKPGQSKQYKPVTVTGQAKVREIIALIDAQPVPSGQLMCPADYGQAVKLTFRATAGGPVLATATLVTSGCEFAELTVGGKQQPAREDGRAVATGSLKIAGVSWKLPPALP